MRRRGSFKGSSLFLVGAAHTLTNIKQAEDENPKAYPAFKYMGGLSPTQIFKSL
jgi:hypothetical protein